MGNYSDIRRNLVADLKWARRASASNAMAELILKYRGSNLRDAVGLRRNERAA